MTATPGSILLDSQALSLLVRRDRSLGLMADKARRAGIPVHVSILTVIEAAQGRFDRSRLDWVLSRLYRVESVTPADGMTALDLLGAAGNPSGHAHAIDAAVAALALRLPGPTIVYTSDPDDWRRLLGRRVTLVTV